MQEVLFKTCSRKELDQKVKEIGGRFCCWIDIATGHELGGTPYGSYYQITQKLFSSRQFANGHVIQYTLEETIFNGSIHDQREAA